MEATIVVRNEVLKEVASNTKSSGTQSRFAFPTARDLGNEEDPIVDPRGILVTAESHAKYSAQNDAFD